MADHSLPPHPLKVCPPEPGIVACLNPKREWGYFRLWNNTYQPSNALSDGYTDLQFIPWDCRNGPDPTSIVENADLRKLHVTHIFDPTMMAWVPVGGETPANAIAAKWLAILNAEIHHEKE